MKRLLSITVGILILALSLNGYAQVPSITVVSGGLSAGQASFPNDGTTGTVLNALAKLTSATPAAAILVSTADTNGAVGIVVSGAGTSGNATVQLGAGVASCLYDGATTAGDYVKISSLVAGDCADAGSTYPASGQVIGRVLQTIGSAGLASTDLFDEIQSGSRGTTMQIANNASGTTLNTLTKITGAPSTATKLATTDTGGAFGVDVGAPGTTGNTVIQTSGNVPCVFDGATTAGDFVGPSATVAGDCHDISGSYVTGAQTGQVVGRVLSTNGAGGTYTMWMMPPAMMAPMMGGAAGTIALGTAAIASNACAATVTAAVSNVATSNVVLWSLASDPTTIAGYGAGAGGALAVWAFPTAGNVNFRVCNLTAASITPGAMSVNYRVMF